MKNPHTELVNEICISLSKLDHCRVWKAPTGMTESGIRYGVPGMPDIMGIVKLASNLGLCIGIEVKTGSGRVSMDQKKFHGMIFKMGGQICVARSTDDALAFVYSIVNRDTTQHPLG